MNDVNGVLRVLVCIAAGLGPACLYTDPVNEKPTMGPIIILPTPDVRVGQELKLSVPVTDDRSDYDVYWVVVEGQPCPAVTVWPEQALSVKTRELPLAARTDLTPCCVYARAVDHYGAAAEPVAITIKATNSAPYASIQVVSPFQTWKDTNAYRFQTEFRLSAAASYDPDGTELSKLRFLWHVSGPGAYTSNERRCADAPGDESLMCFTGTIPGLYTVSLTVTDPANLDGQPVRAPLTVLADQKPCLPAAGTSPTTVTPIVLGVGESRSLQVTWVDDDLDPWPSAGGGEATLRWWMRRKGISTSATVPWELIVGNWSQLDIPGGTFDSGDVDICVQAFDRTAYVDGAIPLPAQPSCDAEASASFTPCPSAAIWKLSYR